MKREIKEQKDGIHSNRKNTALAKIPITENINIIIPKSLQILATELTHFVKKQLKSYPIRKHEIQWSIFQLTKNSNESSKIMTCEEGKKDN